MTEKGWNESLEEEKGQRENIFAEGFNSFFGVTPETHFILLLGHTSWMNLPEHLMPCHDVFIYLF